MGYSSRSLSEESKAQDGLENQNADTDPSWWHPVDDNLHSIAEVRMRIAVAVYKQNQQN